MFDKSQTQEAVAFMS